MREVPLSSFVCMITVSVLITMFVAPLSQTALADTTAANSRFSHAAPDIPRHQLSSTPRYMRPQETLSRHDELATLEAIHRGLSETADGDTFVWRSSNGRLNAVLQPTTSFLDKHQHVCRHIVVLLNSGLISRRAEGIACRKPGGTWNLAG